MAGYPTDPIGTVTMTDIAITSMTGANSASYITDFELTNVTIAGNPVTG